MLMARSLTQLIYAMGGSVSAGKSNDELIDHLVDAEFIKSPAVQRVFRAVDRGNYYHPAHKDNAYKDIAWKMGNLHLSAPCVYSVVMEALKLKPGLSFLNLGSGSGYLSTMVGLILGQYGVNHGIELHQDIVDYSYERLDEFLKNSKIVDEIDFCEPVFTTGNFLTMDNNFQQYDRVYCGAACPEEYESLVKNFVKINGILIMPLNDKLLKITRVDETNWVTVKILSVSFAPLVPPPTIKNGQDVDQLNLSDITPPNLLQICRFYIRSTLRQHVDIEHPALKQNIIRKESRPRRHVRRIVIPFFDESDLSNSQSDSDIDYDSDSPEYTISSRIPSRMSVFLEDFVRRHAERQLLREVEQMEEELRSGNNEEEAANSDDKRMEREIEKSDEDETVSPILVDLVDSANHSDESDSNINEPPSQSTRSKRRTLLKRKHSPSNSPDRQSGSGPSSGSATAESRRKILCTAGRVVFKKKGEPKKEPEKEDNKEEANELNYTNYLLEKIEALPLPPYLQQYLNYRRNNLHGKN